MPRNLGGLVDVDIHHRWKDENEVIAYLPVRWKEYLDAGFSPRHRLKPPMLMATSGLTGGGRRRDSVPVDGSAPGSDYGTLKQQLLDRHEYSCGVLTFDVGHEAGQFNRDFALALCRAMNDWNKDHWLGLDDRLRSVVVIPSADPVGAAAEIRRVGIDTRIVGALMATNFLGRPFGDPLFHPIYEAASEMGLAVDIHTSMFANGQPMAELVGPLATGIENATQLGQPALHHITSLIVHGVFEKYPTLQVVLKEFGVAWLPSLIWKLDASYRALQFESTWVKRWPSEYIQRNIKLSTQPLEEGPNPLETRDLLATVDLMEDVLCYASDYPHISFDDPDYIANLIPGSWMRKVFHDNAHAAYRLGRNHDQRATSVRSSC